MTYELIDKLPAWGLLALLVAVLALASQLGRRLGMRRAAAEGGDGDAESPHTGAVVGSLLGLLGLLLAFAYGGVDSRFAARKQLVLDDANAIGTTFLRAGLLDQEQRDAVRSALGEYVDLRVGLRTPADVERALSRSDELHQKLWRRAEEAAGRHPDSVMVSLFVSSLNEMIDLQEKRVTVGIYQRLPPTTLMVLGTVAFLSLGVLGYAGGVVRTRSRFPSVAIVLAVSFVIMLVMELDRPYGRLYQVGNRAMIDVKTMIDAYNASPHPPH